MTRLDFDVAISAFRPVEGAWAAAAGVEVADVRQEVALAVWAGLDPASAVPKALRIRRLGADWRSFDVSVLSSSLDDLGESGFDVPIEIEEGLSGVSGFDGVAEGGTAEIARRAGISRRAAQMRVVAQIARAEACGDLFCRSPQ